MDNDDDLIGMTFNFIIGTIVVTIEISMWLVAAVCMGIVAIFELFFED